MRKNGVSKQKKTLWKKSNTKQNMSIHHKILTVWPNSAPYVTELHVKLSLIFKRRGPA